MNLAELVAASRPTTASLAAVSKASGASAPSSTILNNGSAAPNFSQINNKGSIFTTTPQNTGFTLGNGSKQVAGIGDMIKAAAEGGANQSNAGINEAGEGLNTGNPLKMAEGTLNTLAGTIQAAGAITAPLFAPLGAATDYLGKQLGSHYSDNPIISNDTATRIVQAISNGAIIAGTFMGGAETPKAEIPTLEVPTKVPVRSETPPSPVKTVIGDVSAQKAGTSGSFDGKVAPLQYGKLEPSSLPGDNIQKVDVPLKDLKRSLSADSQAPQGAGPLKNAKAVELEERADGSYIIHDGNHRIQQAIDDGYTHIPAYVSKSFPSIPKEVEPQVSPNVELNPDEVASLDSYVGLRKELADATKQLQGMKGAPKTGTSQTLKPIEGTGAVKTRGLSEGVEANAIEKKLTDNFGDLPEYKQVSMKDQAQRAASLIESDPVSARAIAMGEKAPPKGLLPESVYVAAEHKATTEGDVQTLRDLANSKLSASATTMGQRIRTLGERDSNSPLAAIQEVQKARVEAQAARGETPEKVTNQVTRSIRKGNTKETWSDFIKNGIPDC